MAKINSPDNGATEIPGTSNDSLFVFLAGPIRHWWKPGMWDTGEHSTYCVLRETIWRKLSDEFLVYAPHKAWRGPWNEVAQSVNDHAISLAHAFVRIDVTGVPAIGTDLEYEFATHLAIPTFGLASVYELDALIEQLRELDKSHG